MLAPLRALHERYGADPPPLPGLLRQRGKLFRRNTFCESPRTCLKQLWTERLSATLEMLDVLAAYQCYLEQHAAHYRNEGAGVDDALNVLAELQPAVRAYAHALTNFFRTEVEVDAARERLRAGQGDSWKAVLDVARLDREALPVAAMELCSQRFEDVRVLVEGYLRSASGAPGRHAEREYHKRPAQIALSSGEHV